MEKESKIKVISFPAFSNKNENPYNWLLYTNIMNSGVFVEDFSPWKILKGKYDIFHIHWPERFFGSPVFPKALLKTFFFLFILFIARIKKAKIFWTIHNLRSHENYHPGLESFFWKSFIPMIDGYISLSEEADSIAKKIFPGINRKKGFIIPIGHYKNYYPDFLTKELARRKISIPLNKKVMLYFGLIRNYKNVLSLIKSFQKLNNEDILLLVVGKPFSDKIKREIEMASFEDKRIKLFLRFVTDEEVEIFMKATDIMVLPQKEVFNSSSVILALSYNIPVLVPERFTGREMKRRFGEDWVKTFEELNTEVLKDALEWMEIERNQWNPPEEMDWSFIAKKTLEAYKSVMEL